MLFPVILLAVSASLVTSEIPGGSCSSNSDCQWYDRHSECDSESGTCTCSYGFSQPQGEWYCARIVPGSECTVSADRCAESVLGLVCQAGRRTCECPANHKVVDRADGTRICSAMSSDASCVQCTNTGGYCFADATNGDQLDCHCPINMAASNGITSGCDQIFALVGGICTPDGSVPCQDEFAVCRHSGLLSNDYTCQCRPGYATVARSWDPRRSDCVKRLSEFDDPSCATCEANGGQCLDADDDWAMDATHGCLCPASRSSSGPEPENACVNKHFEVLCNATHYSVCYRPEDNPYHTMLTERLDNDEAVLYVLGFPTNPACYLESTSDGYCRTFDHGNIEECKTTLVTTVRAVSYSNWIYLQRDVLRTSPFDLCVHAECSWDKIVFSNSEHLEIVEDKDTGEVGEHEVAGIMLTPITVDNENAANVGINFGDDLKLRVEIVDDAGGLFTSARTELCVASNLLSLIHSDIQATVFIQDGCPVGVFGDINFAHVSGVRYETGYFQAPVFDLDMIYFHCAIRVCIAGREAECAPRDCGKRRRKRSLAAEILAVLRNPDLDRKVVAVHVSRTSIPSDDTGDRNPGGAEGDGDRAPGGGGRLPRGRAQLGEPAGAPREGEPSMGRSLRRKDEVEKAMDDLLKEIMKTEAEDETMREEKRATLPLTARAWFMPMLILVGILVLLILGGAIYAGCFAVHTKDAKVQVADY